MAGKENSRDLATRLAVWAQDTHGWEARFVPSDVHSQSVAFRIGQHTGYGKTTNEAVNACADALVEDGWPDDRDDCTRCEGGGNYSEMAPCTTFGPDCGCHERVLVDPCPDCEGTGYAA